MEHINFYEQFYWFDCVYVWHVYTYYTFVTFVFVLKGMQLIKSS